MKSIGIFWNMGAGPPVSDAEDQGAEMLAKSALVLATLIAANAASAETAPRAAMGPFTLGMSLDQARAVPLTSTNEKRAGMLICAGDKGAPALLKSFSADPDIIVCAAGLGGLNWGIVLGDGLALNPTLIFKTNELIDITATFGINDVGRVRDAITDRFGEFAKQDGEIRNGLGNPIPQITLSWSVASDDIVLTAPDGHVDKFTVEYSDRAQLAALNKSRSEQRAASTGL